MHLRRAHRLTAVAVRHSVGRPHCEAWMPPMSVQVQYDQKRLHQNAASGIPARRSGNLFGNSPRCARPKDQNEGNSPSDDPEYPSHGWMLSLPLEDAFVEGHRTRLPSVRFASPKHRSFLRVVGARAQAVAEFGSGRSLPQTIGSRPGCLGV
jgi:hypothetical protein